MLLPGTRFFDRFWFNSCSDNFVCLTSDLTEGCHIGETDITGSGTCAESKVDSTTSETFWKQVDEENNGEYRPEHVTILN